MIAESGGYLRVFKVQTTNRRIRASVFRGDQILLGRDHDREPGVERMLDALAYGSRPRVHPS
jgi:hypothetical protein